MLIGASVFCVALFAGLSVLMFTLEGSGGIFWVIFIWAIFVGCVPFVVRGYEIEGERRSLFSVSAGKPGCLLPDCNQSSRMLRSSRTASHFGNGGLLSSPASIPRRGLGNTGRISMT